MRKQFGGYYRPTEAEFKALWNDCFFSFDANVLLNFYRYRAETRDNLFRILQAIRDRMWLTHQAAKEHFEGRLAVIQGQVDAYSKVIESLEDSRKKLEGSVSEYSRHSTIDVKRLMATLDKAYAEAKAALERVKGDHPDLLRNDDVLDRLTELFDGRVGDCYSDEELPKIIKQAEERAKKKTPPGFRDANKEGERQHGDTLIWLQLLAEASERKRPVIFVTDDAKDDWWLTHNGKRIGPRPELIAEARQIAKVPLYVYASAQFIEYADKHLGTATDKAAIADVKEAQKREKERHTSISITEWLRIRSTLESQMAVLKRHKDNLVRQLSEIEQGTGTFSGLSLDERNAMVGRTISQTGVVQAEMAEVARNLVKVNFVLGTAPTSLESSEVPLPLQSGTKTM